MSISDLEVFLIKGYRKVSQPIHSSLEILGLDFGCRFEPSCSHYAEDALLKYGAYKGTILTLKRISRCRPGYGGHDPLE